MEMSKNPEMSEVDQYKAFKEFLMRYNKLSETCFTACVHDFTSRNIRASEEKCAVNCMDKFFRTNQRIVERFHEHQILQNENVLAMAKKTGQVS